MHVLYPQVQPLQPAAVVKQAARPSAEFVERIRAAYRHALELSRGPGESTWTMISGLNQPIHELLLGEGRDEELIELLAAPGKTKLFFGFDSIFDDILKRLEDPDAAAVMESQRINVASGIVRLAEALAVRCVVNPEGGGMTYQPDWHEGIDLDALLTAIGERLEVAIDFPNPFAGEFGVQTLAGVASERAIQAIYQAARLRELRHRSEGSVLEIGAGLGRTAYYAARLGFADYTVVDLPLTNVAQALYLGHVLGEEAVSLQGEPARVGQLRIRSPEWLHSSDERFGLVLNADSLTEMDRAYAEEYARFIRARSVLFLSINHEVNPFRVRDLAAFADYQITRHPYWMRTGYVDELYERRS